MGRKPKNQSANAGAEKAPVTVSQPPSETTPVTPIENPSASDLLKQKISENGAQKSSPKKNDVSNHKKFDKFK